MRAGLTLALISYAIIIASAIGCYAYCIHTAAALSSTRASLHWSAVLVTKINLPITIVYVLVSALALLSAAFLSPESARARSVGVTAILLLVPCAFLAWTCHTYLTKLGIQLS